MKKLVFAACAAILAGVALPAAAAQPDAAAQNSGSAATADNAITFENYRDWRLAASERRRSEIDMQLSDADLAAPRKARLEEKQAYYKWLAGLPEADRDRRFRERFDRIDANRDAIIDPDERALWRQKQRAYYGSRKPAGEQPGDQAARAQ